VQAFDYGKALTDMWALGSKALLDAQQQALRAMREGASAVAVPGGAAAPPPVSPDLALDAGRSPR
jgi:hypothetical protein